MKNTLLILSFLFPALAFGQFGLGNPNRTLTELGRQTTARGIVYYASGPPNTVITYRPNRDTAAYMWVDTLTSRRYEWNHAGNFWATQGIVSGASAPAATQTNGPALIDNRDAFFRSTVDNLFYFYDRTNLTWAEFGSGGGATCGDCPITANDPLSGDGTTGNPLTLKGYSSATAGQYPVKNTGTGFAWNTVGLDTFAIVSNTLRASIYGDNVPFKSVSLAPYLDNTDAQNLTINGTSAPYVLAISGGSDVEFDEGVGIGLNESPANTLVITNTLPDVTVSLTGAGINNVTGTYPNFTITGTEVDGSTTNEMQTLANTSDATSHTVTLSNSGGSVKLVEGSGITLTTTGTSGDGIVTIAATGGGGGGGSDYLGTGFTSGGGIGYIPEETTAIFAGDANFDAGYSGFGSLFGRLTSPDGADDYLFGFHTDAGNFFGSVRSTVDSRWKTKGLWSGTTQALFEADYGGINIQSFDGTGLKNGKVNTSNAVVEISRNDAGELRMNGSGIELKANDNTLTVGAVYTPASVSRLIQVGADDAFLNWNFTNSEGGFDFQTTTGALIPPRLTTSQRDALPDPIEDGSIIRNTDDAETQVYNAATDTWEALSTPGMGGGSGVVSVTGSGVDNTDVHNPVVNARPYKVYTALLTQSGTSAPVATVLENTLGGTVTWNYEDVGDYSATLTGAFTTGKTWIIVGTDTATFSSYHTNPNSVGITSPAGNGALSSRSIEIRVYP